MNDFYIGVDPGLDGAIAVLDKDGGLVQIYAMPSRRCVLVLPGEKHDYP